MIGARVNYETPSGHRVQALCCEERSNLPVFDVEIIDAAGVVIEYIPNVMGNTGLMFLARKRNWREVQR